MPLQHNKCITEVFLSQPMQFEEYYIYNEIEDITIYKLLATIAGNNFLNCRVLLMASKANLYEL